MNNLFVCHTQYDLLMSLAIMKQHFFNDKNDLVLFSDFTLNDDMKSVLEHSFANSIFLRGERTKYDSKYSHKASAYKKTYVQLNEFLAEYYDNLFWKCDYSWPEIWLNKKIHKKNEKLIIYWLEDGAYFVLDNQVVDLKNNKLKFFLRQCIGKMLFGKYYSFNGIGIGTSTWNNFYCLTFPDAVRDKYKSKPYISVSESSFGHAMTVLYRSCDVEVDDGSVVLFLDKIDRYKILENVVHPIESLLQECENMGVKLYYKYHPRENRKIEQLASRGIEINRSIGAEGLYSCNIGRKIKVVGIASTSLQTARKCGFEVYSMAQITGESNDDINRFYKKIGICMMSSVSELFLVSS